MLSTMIVNLKLPGFSRYSIARWVISGSSLAGLIAHFVARLDGISDELNKIVIVTMVAVTVSAMFVAPPRSSSIINRVGAVILGLVALQGLFPFNIAAVHTPSGLPFSTSVQLIQLSLPGVVMLAILCITEKSPPSVPSATTP